MQHLHLQQQHIHIHAKWFISLVSLDGKLVQRINQVIQVGTNILGNFGNLFDTIQNVNRLGVGIVTDSEGTLQVHGCPFADLFLGGAEGFGDKVERLEGGYRIALSGGLFWIEGEGLRLTRQGILERATQVRSAAKLQNYSAAKDLLRVLQRKTGFLHHRRE